MASGADHEALTRGLRFVHLALRRSLDAAVSAAARPPGDDERAPLADFCQRLARFVHGHHDGEEEVVFPALEKAGLADVATWRRDHETLLPALSRFESATAAYRAGGPAEPLATAATTLRDILLPHLDAEEAVLDSALRDLVTPDHAADLARAASRHGQRHGGPTVLLLFLHSLSSDEQRAHFAHLPWPVRRLLIPLWARSFRPALRYAHNPTIAI